MHLESGKRTEEKNETSQKTAEGPRLFYKECVVATSEEKSERFKQLLKDTLQNNLT